MDVLDQQEKEKLRGVWLTLSSVVDGKEIAEPPERVRLIYEGANFQVKQGDTVINAGVSKHDPVRKELEITWSDGPNQGKSGLGIYRLDGDTYEACVAMPGKARPRGFMSKPGSGHACFILKREKP